jgi:hypothetical protein
MVRSAVLGATLLALTTTPAISAAADDEGWISLFDGATLEGWRVSEHPDSASVQDSVIVLAGPRAHVFYVGDVQNHDFKDFELKLEVLAKPGANSGVYFHTEYQDEGWPSRGYEAQVNNTQSDWRRTGSLYGIEDVKESPVKDDEWWEYHLLVEGKRIVLTVNGQTTVDYTEGEDVKRPEDMKGRLLSSGTIALQCHDPGSEVHYRNIRIKPIVE